jgi:YihY family inner membrane protein
LALGVPGDSQGTFGRSFGAFFGVRIVVQTGSNLADALGWTGGAGVVSILAEVASSALVVFAGLLALYRFVPPVTMPLRVLWPSALAAAVAFEVVVEGYAVYAAQFAGFSAIYGPMGPVLAFLLLVYVLAVIVLLGAEMAIARAG